MNFVRELSLNSNYKPMLTYTLANDHTSQIKTKQRQAYSRRDREMELTIKDITRMQPTFTAEMIRQAVTSYYETEQRISFGVKTMGWLKAKLRIAD